jgi:hypothetical protein
LDRHLVDCVFHFNDSAFSFCFARTSDQSSSEDFSHGLRRNMIRNGSLNILINKQRIVAPTCYAELKTRQYVRLLKEWEWHKELADRDFFQLFSILSDTDYNAITRTIENDIALMDIVGWILTEEPTFKTAPTPTAFEFNDEIFSIDKLPGEMSIGQNIHLRSDFIEKSKLLEESISIAIAIYLQPQITKGKFNLNKAKELAKVIDEMPITRTYPLGFFLLLRVCKFGLMPAKIYKPMKINLGSMLKRIRHASRRFSV